MSSGRHILSAYGTSLLGVVSALLTNFWLLREVAQAVDKESFGLYGLALQITSYLVLLQAGLDFAVSRQIAEALGRHDFTTANGALVELRRFNQRAGLACLAATILVALSLRFAVAGATRATLCGEIALLTGLAQTLLFWSRTATAALVGSHLMAITNLVTVGNSIATSLLAFLLLKLGWGILCLPVAGLFIQAASWACLHCFCNARCTWLDPRPPSPDPNRFKQLFAFGLFSTVAGAGWTVESTCDVFILQSVAGAEAVAAYVLWWRFPQLAFSACTSLTTSAFPSLAQKLAGSPENGAQLLAKVFWLQIGLGTMALLGFGVWLPGFMRLWVGPSYALPNGAAVALAIGGLVCIRACGNLIGTAWLARGNAKLLAVTSWIQAALKLALGIWWAPTHGLLGLVLASCVTMSIQCCVFGALLHRQGFLTAKLARTCLLLLVTALAVAALAAGRFPAPSLPGFVLGTAATGVAWAGVWLALAWRGELGPRLRQLQLRWLSRQGVAS